MHRRAVFVGLQDHLNASSRPCGERLIHFPSLINFRAMRNHKTRVDLAFLNLAKQIIQVFLDVGLAHLEGEAFSERSSERELIEEASINARDRNHSTGPAAIDCLPNGMRAIGTHVSGNFYSYIPVVEGMPLLIEPDTVDHRI